MCKVSTQTKDNNIDPNLILSLEAYMAALKSFLMDEIYDLKNQEDFHNTGKMKSKLLLINLCYKVKIIYQTC